jgi:ectoine hydroxylase-related dioxygenase (phytanoyl-CoA dioxygenase family)
METDMSSTLTATAPTDPVAMPLDSWAHMSRFGGSLTPAQRRQYDVDGYVVLANLLDEQDMEAPRRAMTQKVDSIAADLLAAGLISDPLVHEPFKYRLARLFAGLSDEQFLRYGRSWRDRLPGYFHLMSNPKILDAVESLIGGEIFSNPVYNVRPKVPIVAAGAVPWHQDKSYWPDANSNPVITVWIPLVDSTHENGCLHLIPGTHRKKVIRFHAEQRTGTAYTETDLDVVRQESARRQIIALPVPAGSAILFNDRLLHSSTPNNSDHVRWSVDLRYQPTDQDTMPQHGVGFLARSRINPDRVATLDDWLAGRPDAGGMK